ncbi:MAG: flagellin [Mycobacterium leprae]
MRINTNMAAMNAWRALESNQANLQNSLQRLSSGYRVNRAADDAAGLAVSEKLKAQMRGVNMAVRNTQDAVSLIQTAEGGASSIQDMLQRMRELAVQAGSDTLSNPDRAQLQEEFSSLQAEIDRTAGTVQFNGTKLLDGTVGSKATLAGGATGISAVTANNLLVARDTETLAISYVETTGVLTVGALVEDTDYTWNSGEGVFTGINGYAGLSFRVDISADASGSVTLAAKNLTFQVGANNGETIATSMANLTSANLNIGSLNIGTRTGATDALSILDNAVSVVSTQRAKMGAMQNRLDNTISTLQTQSENITSANSRIRDIDMASEMASFTKFQVLSQASTAMLAQANQLPQGILTLLR